MTEHLSILNKAEGTLPRVPFVRIKDAALGKDYDLSLVFVGEEEARDISIRTKKKDYVPNVLSFPLDDASGEVFICPAEAGRQAPSFGRTTENFIAYLFIHALCHLKGMDHGATMERTEARLREEFGI